MTQYGETAHQHPPAAPRVTLRGPAELIDSLPYLLGHHPDDSVVLIGLHGPEGRFGGRVRVGVPCRGEGWDELADRLSESGAAHGGRPDGTLVLLFREPARGEGGRSVMERLRPLPQRLRTACGALDMPVYEALCASGGRSWSYCYPGVRCCPAGGMPLSVPGTAAMTAAAAYAGLRVAGSLKEMNARLARLDPSAAEPQERGWTPPARLCCPGCWTAPGAPPCAARPWRSPGGCWSATVPRPRFPRRSRGRGAGRRGGAGPTPGTTGSSPTTRPPP